MHRAAVGARVSSHAWTQGWQGLTYPGRGWRLWTAVAQGAAGGCGVVDVWQGEGGMTGWGVLTLYVLLSLPQPHSLSPAHSSTHTRAQTFNNLAPN